MKKTTKLLVCACLSVAVFSGCTENASNTNTNDSGVAVIELDIMEACNAGAPSGEKDFILAQLEQELNVKINLNSRLGGDDYKNQLNVRIAGGNPPDFFQVLNRAYLVENARKGNLLDLTSIKSEMGDLLALVGDDALQKCYVDGSLMGWSKADGIAYSTLWIRNDWLNNVGMQQPTTLDQYFEVLKAFTQNDPDKNDKADTYGLTGGAGGVSSSYINGTFADVFGAFGIGAPGEMYIKDGKLENALYAPEMKQALAYIKDMIDAGVVDPEVMVVTGAKRNERAYQGRAGSINTDWPSLTKDEFVDQIKQINPEAEWLQLEPLQGPNGNISYTNSADIGGSAIFAIPKSMEKTPDKLDRIIQLLNYVSDLYKGGRLVMYGLENEHYTLQDDQVQATPKLDQEGSWFWVYQFTGRPEMEYLGVKFQKQLPYISFASEQNRLKMINGLIDIGEDYVPADADRYIVEEITKFIYGKRSIDEYDDFLNTLGTQFNYKSYYDSAVQQAAEMGMTN